MKKFGLPWIQLLGALLLNGCASVSAFKGFAVDDESLYVSGLPPITQDKHYACGAACVAAVAAFWNVSPADFRTRHPQLPADMTGEDLQMLARELGLNAFAYQGSLEDLQANLRQGRPLIVMIAQPLLADTGPASVWLLNGWNRWGPKPAHWVVVVGITQHKNVIIHDPAAGPLSVKWDVFKGWWAKNGNLAVLVAAQ